MGMRQTATRVDEEQYELFKATTRDIGTTPADALRMFIYAFNEHRGFPYEVRTSKPIVEPFNNEKDATRFATSLSMGVLNATR